MRSYQGIGTTLYGKRDVSTDGSYIATEWFTFFWLPIFPFGSYRVWQGTINAKFSPIYSSTEYKLVKISLNWKQVLTTYLITWGSLAILITIYLS